MSASCLAFHFVNSLRTSSLVSSWQTCQSSKRFRENVMRMTLGTSWGSCSECKLNRTKLNSCWPWPHHGPRGVTLTRVSSTFIYEKFRVTFVEVKKKAKFFLVTPRNHRGTSEVWLHSFLTSVLNGSRQLHAPASLPSWKNLGSHCIWGWVGPTSGLDLSGKQNSLSLSLYIYIYIFIYLFIYMCVLFPVLHITIGKTSWSKTIRKIITSYFFRNRTIHGPPLYIEISVLNLQLFIFKTNTTYIYNCALEGKNNGLWIRHTAITTVI